MPVVVSRSFRIGEAVTVVGGSALLVGSWVVAVTDGLPPLESVVFAAVNGLPDDLWPVVWAPMQAGSFVGSIAVGGVTGMVSRQPKLAGAALVASQTAFWSSKLIKRWVGRGRPGTLIPRVHEREHASGFGYVSGHAAVSFALAAVLAPSVPGPGRLLVFAAAAFVGAARQYAGVHLPLDVLGGAGAGLVLGTLTRWAFGLEGAGVAPSSRPLR